ncbi:MAG: peptide chain release factor N(5)-glutamine methyltransferase [Methylophagaceae bacterium]
MTISEALQSANALLLNSESPEIDSQILLCHVLHCQKTYLHTWPDKKLNESERNNFNDLIQQRVQGHPIAHLTERHGFWSLDLNVSPDTLIPRPDTELLVSLALELSQPNMLIADLGTGTGAIALSLATEMPTATFLAMDLSKKALAVAKQNMGSHQLNNVNFWQGSWLTAIAENALDIVVSNPPYIEQNDPHLSQGDVRFEPMLALVSGIDGLDDIRQIIEQAQYCLKPSGWLLIEHGYQQAQQVQQLFLEANFTNVTSQQDYGGNDRVVLGQLQL